MITLLLERTPDLLPWTTATGWQVIRMDWSAPREVVKSSLGDTSDNSDCVHEHEENEIDTDERIFPSHSHAKSSSTWHLEQLDGAEKLQGYPPIYFLDYGLSKDTMSVCY